MIYIAHRGNTNGVCALHENSKRHIHDALSLGFDVEIDVRSTDDGLCLGHDRACERISCDEIAEHIDKLWLHAKDIDTLDTCIQHGFHVFWHAVDDYALTSQRFIWTNVGNCLTRRSVFVMPELTYNLHTIVEKMLYDEPYAVCSDIVSLIKEHVLAASQEEEQRDED